MPAVPPRFALFLRKRPLAARKCRRALTGAPAAAYSFLFSAVLSEGIRPILRAVLHQPTALFADKTGVLFSGHSIYNENIITIICSIVKSFALKRRKKT